MKQHQPDPVIVEREFQSQLRQLYGPEAALARAAAVQEREREERDRLRAEQGQRWAEEDAREREARERQREADRLARVKTAEAELKTRMRAAFLEQPGSTEAGFKAAWPEMLKRHQIEQTLAVARAGDPVQRLAQEMRAARGAPVLYQKAPTSTPQPIETDG